mgnify:CR=1 FL=1
MASIKLNHIKVKDYKPKELLALLEVYFVHDGKEEIFQKEYLLRNAMDIITNLFLEIKSKNKILFDDPSLSAKEMLERYSPIHIYDQENVEEKIFNFVKGLCDKAVFMKNTKDARTYMKFFDEFRTATLKL